MSMFQSLLLLTAGLAYLSPLCVAVEFYVTPTHSSNQTCPDQPNCYTLDQYTRNSSLLEGQTNISLIFLDGTHTLTEDWEIIEIEKLVISGAGQLPDRDEINVTINLKGRLVINSVPELCIYSLSFNGMDVIDTELSTMENTIQLYNVRSIEVYQVTFLNARTLIVNNGSLSHKAEIRESMYYHSPLSVEIGQFLDNATFSLRNTDIIGSGLVFGCYVLGCNPSALISVNVQDVHMKGGGRHEGIIISTIPILTLTVVDTEITGYDKGLTILNYNKMFVRIPTTVIVKNSSIIRNINGIYLSGLATFEFEVDKANIIENINGMVISDSNDIIMDIKDTRIENNTRGLIVRNSENITSVLLYSNVRGNQYGIFITHSTMLNTTLSECKIVENEFGFSEYSNKTSFRLSHSRVNHNGFGLTLQEQFPEHQILFENVTVESNQILAIGLLNCLNVIVKDCLFDGNRGTAINALRSTVVLEGNTDFTNNEANRGGAISLSFSTVKFANNSKIMFQNNFAREVGGAILVVSERQIVQSTFRSLVIALQEQILNNMSTASCFYQLEAKDYQELTSLNIHVTFVNNSANFGGETMYGATFYDNCQVSGNFMIQNKSDVDFIVDNILHVTDTVSARSLSSFSSDPTRACFCDSGVPQCANTTFLVLNETRYPGERFDIPLVVVGNQYGTLTASCMQT